MGRRKEKTKMVFRANRIVRDLLNARFPNFCKEIKLKESGLMLEIIQENFNKLRLEEKMYDVIFNGKISLRSLINRCNARKTEGVYYFGITDNNLREYNNSYYSSIILTLVLLPEHARHFISYDENRKIVENQEIIRISMKETEEKLQYILSKLNLDVKPYTIHSKKFITSDGNRSVMAFVKLEPKEKIDNEDDMELH